MSAPVKNARISLPLVVFVLCAATTVMAGTIYYVDDDKPADFNNIQAAINYSSNGDTILVADGTYRGNGNRDIDFKGKAVTLRSENGPANCIIDCQGSESVPHLGFYFHSDEGPDSVLDGFTITNGYHEDAGAILCTYIPGGGESSPTITNCIITHNQGKYAGAIECRYRCEPEISNCIISDNIGKYRGGINYWGESHPVVSNCIIRGNTGQGGGGITTGGAHCYGTILNCLIVGNHSANRGGGIGWWSWGGSLTIINCTVANNIGIGGINLGGGGDMTGTITNSIIWGNRVEGNSIQIDFWDMTPEVTFCGVEGGWPGEGNIDADPLFVDADGLDNAIGTTDDNLRLLGGSPCLDAGNNLAVPPSLTTDLDGNPRIINGTVDMGAYEGPKQGLVVIPQSLVVPEGGTNSFTVALGLDPAGTVQVSVAVESGDPDITVKSGATLVFDSSNYSQPQTVTLAAAEDEDRSNGAATVSISAAGFSTVTVSATEVENDHIIYVDADATGANNGTSWANAFTKLQDALTFASSHAAVKEIRVAQGIYKPDRGAGITPGDREVSFQLINGVAIKGAYAGYGQSDPDARDIVKYETILSGDLDGDDAAVADPCDLLDESSRAENSYHVVASFDSPDYPEVNAILDCFTITGGNANGESNWPDEWSCGGGLYLYNPWCRGPTISNCKFNSNSGVWAGGIWGCGGPIVNCLITANAASRGGGLSDCSGPIKNSTISNNFARDAGGGIATYLDDHFESCTIIDNVAGVYGGGIYTENCSPILYNCTVRGNRATLGGGMYNRAYDDYSNPVLIGCQFISNLAKEDGGGINNDYPGYYGFLTMTNCIFSGNLAAGIGGGIGNYAETNLILTNCTFAANLATNGNALSCKSQYPEYPYPSDLRLTNCILWDGGNEIWNNDNSTITITYSDVYDGWLGAGNINVDPCFADAAKGDYHLKSQAGRWDANSASWVKDDVTSLCIDAGDPASPIGYEPFPNGGIINMGAYGGTAEASKSYFREPVCETIVAGDINGDCKVNFFDLALMADHWLERHSP